jgi:hypothetical protein
LVEPVSATHRTSANRVPGTPEVAKDLFTRATIERA